MGESRLVGETGPDDAGKNLSPTTVKEYITKHMYHPLKYFFDRKIAIPKGMLEDCHPFPQPTRAYLANPHMGETYALSHKKKVRKTPDRELWRDHLAVSIGSDLHGLTWHNHREAWNVVIFGHKRWLLWDHARWKNNNTMQFLMTRDWSRDAHVPGHEWISRLYKAKNRQYEIRNHGHDCIQGPGDMMFVPHRWMHMVVNVGDTVSVISEVGLGPGEGKKPEDFLFDPNESSGDEGEESSGDEGGGGPPSQFWSGDDEGDVGGRDQRGGPPPHRGRGSVGEGRGPPPQGRRMWWADLPPEIREAHVTLGYDQRMFDTRKGRPPSEDMWWDDLTDEMRDAASVLGFTWETWNEY